jgi:hypothetical protein
LHSLDSGWYFIDKELTWYMAGVHGYESSTSKEMNGIFIGNGSAFKKKKERILKNIELYHIMSRLLGG